MKDKTNLSDLTIAPMSSEARELYENIFLPRYRKLQKEITKTPLVVLVWGPGPSGGDLYSKRLQIRNQLRSWGHAAVFSEEIDVDSPAPAFSLDDREMLQSVESDFIIVIQASPGSIGEVHDFASFTSDLGSKMLIFIDERAQEGYSYTGILQKLKTLYNNVETYKYPRDIKECRLLQAIEEKIRVLQYTKWRQRNLS